jgi:hypothetical protein
MLVFEPVELLLLLMALVVNLIALVFKPISLSLPIKYLLLQFHLVKILIGRLLELPVV